MDLKRVFDLDGSGFIDPIVLARSLKIWDSNVFTDDAISDFYKWSGLANTGGDGRSGSSASGSSGTGGIIAIQELVRFVRASAPKMPRKTRRSSSRTEGSEAGSGAGTESFSAAPRSLRTREPSASAASPHRSKARSKSATRRSREGAGSKTASEVGMSPPREAWGAAASTREAAQLEGTSTTALEPMPPRAPADVEVSSAVDAVFGRQEHSSKSFATEPAGAAPVAAEEPENEPENEPPSTPQPGPRPEPRSPTSLEAVHSKARNTLTEAQENCKLQHAIALGVTPVEVPQDQGLTKLTTADSRKVPPPPAPELMARLARLDLRRVLDVDGTGLIDREVLKCSLQIFDRKVFTDQACESLIYAAAREQGADGFSAQVRIWHLAVFMGVPVLCPVPPSGDMVDEDDDDEFHESFPPSPLTTSLGPYAIGEGLLAHAVGELEEDDWASSAVLHTARTDIESAVGDLSTTSVCLAELRAGALGCTIRRPEMRGITLRQLKRLMNYVEEHCERESWYDPETEQLLTPELVDMSCLTEWVLKPASRDRRCSFVEAIGIRPSKQRPTWYVSHCAGPIKDFVLCLMEHAKRHHFNDDVCYWVDAYAQNMWQEPGDDHYLWEKALSKTEGSVQVIGHGPVAYVEVGAHSNNDGDAQPFHGIRYLTPRSAAASAAMRNDYR